MVEARAANLETWNSSWLTYDYKSRGKAFCPWLSFADVITRTAHVRKVRLKMLAPKKLRLNFPNENVERRARPGENMRKPCCTVTYQHEIFGRRSPTHVGGGNSK